MRGGFEPAAHLGSGDQTGLLEDHAAVTLHHEVRYGLHAEAGGYVRAVLRIHLEDHRAAGHLLRELLHFRRGHAAGTAPGGPEVRQDGDRGFGDDLRKSRFIDIQRFVQRGKGQFAGAAAAGVGEVFRGNTVSFAAGRAMADDWQLCVAGRSSLAEPSSALRAWNISKRI
jgi:hypothetical protein